jgi:hypothetical protein
VIPAITLLVLILSMGFLSLLVMRIARRLRVRRALLLIALVSTVLVMRLALMDRALIEMLRAVMLGNTARLFLSRARTLFAVVVTILLATVGVILTMFIIAALILAKSLL